MEDKKPLKKNPSRSACEEIIKRILMTEVLENGVNRHFRFASDFMNYFESLYPASDALTKQVQRAVKAMNMPKDEKGYFIVNKTALQLEQEAKMSELLKSANVSVDSMENIDVIFLSVSDYMKPYLIHLLETTETFANKYVTIAESTGGLLIYTRNKHQLLVLLDSLNI